MENFFEELKKRNVYRVATAYAISGWLIIQVANTVGPNLNLSDSIPSLITKILMVGFPIALLLAWLYELTPKGFKRTGTYQEETRDNNKVGRRLNNFIIGMLAFALCFVLVERVFFAPNKIEIKQEANFASIPKNTSSIAVLAFEDMSPDKDQEYLSDGISEEILNYLAKYKDLQVVSRTSSFAYKDKDVSVDVIGEELGVAYVLEGSVRKSGNTYRITVQLIDTKIGTHVWSDTFDRKIEDVLFVQDEIARTVAKRLNLTFSIEDVRLRKVDPEAYDLLLRARAMFIKNPRDVEAIKRADSLLILALSIDSTYALIHARHSHLIWFQVIYRKNIDREEGLRLAMQSAKKAYELDPKNRMSLNTCINASWHLKDSHGFEKYRKELQELGTYPTLFSFYYRRINQVDNGYPYAKMAVEWNPKSLDDIRHLFAYELYYGNFDAARKLVSRIYDIVPDSDYWYRHCLVTYFVHTRQFDKAEALTKEYINEERGHYMYVWARGMKGDIDYFIKHWPYERTSNYNFMLARVYAFNGQIDEAFECLDSAYDSYADQTEWLFITPQLKALHEDPRWQDILDRLSADFNYDFKHGK
jgi:TolB-like protein